MIFVCLALTEANAVTRETGTVSGLRLGPATSPSSPKATASPPSNAEKGMRRRYKKRWRGKRRSSPGGTKLAAALKVKNDRVNGGGYR